MLTAQSILHRYGATTALQAPDFDLGEHEHCAVVGPSGSGKNTLLNVLAGIPTGSATPGLWRHPSSPVGWCRGSRQAG
jgi:ABC-type sugar transport system ATPase subunit